MAGRPVPPAVEDDGERSRAVITAALVVSDEDVVALAEQLIEEFAGVVPAGRVLDCVVRCHDLMIASGLQRGLVPATEAAVRVSLAAEISMSRAS